VDELFMRVGERTLRGEIQEKAKAQAAYRQARSEGKQASIVDQERPNMFTGGEQTGLSKLWARDRIAAMSRQR
jgi:hypothetical protein